MIKFTKIPEQSCRNCGKRVMYSADWEDNVEPRVGDVNVCIECGVLSKYGPGMILFPVSDEEWNSFPGYLKLDIARNQLAIRAMHRFEAATKAPAKSPKIRRRGGVRPGRTRRKDRQSSAWVRDV